MKTFLDRRNREWTIDVSVGSIKRVKSLVEVDLLEAVEGKLIEKLINDPVTLCNVIYALCKEQAMQAGISEEQFGEAMAGEAIDRATEALLGELTNFFPLHRRQALAAAVQKQTEILSKGTKMVLDKINDPATEARILARLQQDLDSAMSGEVSTRSPASSR